ncbi:hypothetical protein KY285_037097 [Solanum tuberosum]|nr:hypothetical protein KY285_037097 [Solanum tuberosum]
MPNIIRSPCSPMSPSSCNIVEGEIENRAPECNNVGSAGNSFCSQKSTPIRRMDSNCISSREGTPGSRQSNSVNMKKMFKKAAEENIRRLGNASPALLGDDPAGYVSSSIKALKQEREYLAKRVSSKLNAEEREMMYMKWDIPPEGKQRRRLQLVNKLWSDPLNMQNERESAEVVTELVGFCETGEHISAQFCFPV